MARKASPAMVFSYWHHLLENVQASPLEFYKALEGALQKRQIPDVTHSRVSWSEGGYFSARREYLRVRRNDLTFDICAAPYGTGFFVSWWLGSLRRWLYILVAVLLLAVPALGWVMLSKMLGTRSLSLFFSPLLWAVPIFGWIFLWKMSRLTYYKVDTALMFQTAVHNSVLEVVDGMTSAKGVRALSELERKPILRGFHKR